MSLINALENLEVEFGDIWISKDLGSQIVTALKAGQTMRNCFIAIIDDTGVSWSVDIKRVNLGVAGLAWDAATKEEV
jgi:hypothetical protein